MSVSIFDSSGNRRRGEERSYDRRRSDDEEERSDDRRRRKEERSDEEGSYDRRRRGEERSDDESSLLESAIDGDSDAAYLLSYHFSKPWLCYLPSNIESSVKEAVVDGALASGDQAKIFSTFNSIAVEEGDTFMLELKSRLGTYLSSMPLPTNILTKSEVVCDLLENSDVGSILSVYNTSSVFREDMKSGSSLDILRDRFPILMFDTFDEFTEYASTPSIIDGVATGIRLKGADFLYEHGDEIDDLSEDEYLVLCRAAGSTKSGEVVNAFLSTVRIPDSVSERVANTNIYLAALPEVSIEGSDVDIDMIIDRLVELGEDLSTYISEEELVKNEESVKLSMIKHGTFTDDLVFTGSKEELMAAIRSGNVDTVELVRKSDDWDDDALVEAFEHNRIPLMRWLMTHGNVSKEVIDKVVDMAYEDNNQEVVDVLSG